MKRCIKLIGLLLIIGIASTGCHSAHRDIKEKKELAKMMKHDKSMEFRHMNRMGREQMGPGGHFGIQGQMAGRRGGMGMNPRMGMNPGMGMGMQRGMGQMGRGQIGRGQMGPNNMMFERLPSLTDKQRKEFADLRLKQAQEMDKFREEMMAKMQSMREANRSKMMNLLTDEQKKFLEAGTAGFRPGIQSVPK